MGVRSCKLREQCYPRLTLWVALLISRVHAADFGIRGDVRRDLLPEGLVVHAVDAGDQLRQRILAVDARRGARAEPLARLTCQRVVGVMADQRREREGRAL